MAALVIAAHGSLLSPTASDPAHAHADRIRAAGHFDEVRTTFWKEEPHYREVLRTLESNEVYVVPLFVSEGYFTEVVLPRELRLVDWDPSLWDSEGTTATAVTRSASDVEATVHYCGPVGTHEAMTAVIVARATSVRSDASVSSSTAVVIVGHGTERNPRSAKAIEYHRDRVANTGGFDEVLALYMDESPYVDDVTDHVTAEDVVIVPLFVADGYHTREDIPRDVGLTEDPSDGWPVPATVDGHRLWYTGAVGTDESVAAVILERAVEAGATIGGDGP